MNRFFFYVLGFVLVLTSWPLQSFLVAVAGVGSIFAGMGRDWSRGKSMTNVRLVPTSIEYVVSPTGIILWFNSEALDVGVCLSKLEEFKELEETIKQAKARLKQEGTKWLNMFLN